MATAPVDSVIRLLRRVARAGEKSGQTDGDLVESFLERKDEAAFEALVRRHGPMVLGVCRRVVRDYHDAEDAFQATFLILVRKATTIRPAGMVANWLHGVAYRTAMKARAMTAKRRTREQQASPMPERESAPHDSWSELRPLLDRELNGLPESYRLAILLCDLEGKTIKEASLLLALPQGTLAGRLTRGRKLLAKRLASRGVTLSAGSLAAVMSQNVTSAGLPAALLDSTVHAAASLAAGRAIAAGSVPDRVAFLMGEVGKSMMLSKFKTFVMTLLVAAIVFGSGRMLAQRPEPEEISAVKSAAAPPDTETTKKAKAEPVATDREQLKLPRFYPTALVQGIVVLKDGKLIVKTNEASSYTPVTEVINGKRVTKYVQGAEVTTSVYEAKDLKVTVVGGKRVSEKELPRLLRKEIIALITYSGEEFDPLHLRFIKDGTLLIHLSRPEPAPATAVPAWTSPAVPTPAEPLEPVPAKPS